METLKKETVAVRSHLSVSQVRKYLKCGLQYYFHYIEGVTGSPPTANMLRGSAVDAAANTHFQSRIDTSKGLTESAFIEKAVHYHDEQKDNYDFALKGDNDYLHSSRIGESRDQTSKLGKRYFTDFANSLVPAEVQKKYEVQYIDKMDFIGYADLITADGTIIDNKVKKRNAVGDLTRDLQLVAYSFLNDGEQTHSEVGLAIVTDTKEPRAFYYTQTIFPEHKKIAKSRINAAYKGLQAKIFNPAPEGSWYCSEKWCEFWAICEFGGSKSVQTTFNL